MLFFSGVCGHPESRLYPFNVLAMLLACEVKILGWIWNHLKCRVHPNCLLVSDTSPCFLKLHADGFGLWALATWARALGL